MQVRQRLQIGTMFADILGKITLFSINLAEAQRLCGLDDPKAIAQKLLGTGLRGVAVRLGSQGTLVADETGLWHIPPCLVDVVDVTGAGNAFTGGFLVGYCEHDGDLVAAGKYGNVAASFMLEQLRTTGTHYAARSSTRQNPTTTPDLNTIRRRNMIRIAYAHSKDIGL